MPVEHRIGAKDGSACTSTETLEQIATVTQMPLKIVHNNELVTWDDLNFTDERAGEGMYSLMQTIVRDRKKRIDEHILMNSRPPYIVCDEENGEIVRFRYYEYDGEDDHFCEYDFKAPGV